LRKPMGESFRRGGEKKYLNTNSAAEKGVGLEAIKDRGKGRGISLMELGECRQPGLERRKKGEITSKFNNTYNSKKM